MSNQAKSETEGSRQELGESDRPIEDSLENAFERLLSEGAQRLHRTWREVLATGFFGGLEVGFGVLALLAVYEETGSHLLAGVAFSIGFLALQLGRSELFTEGFLLPVTAVVSERASWQQLLKLWSGTLVANLAGGYVFMLMAMAAFPRLHEVVVESGTHFAEARWTTETVVLAILGGATITLMTRMQHGTESDVARIVACVAGGFLLAGLQMHHSILDSLLIFGALDVGAPFGWGEWWGWFWPAVLLNMAGGLVLVTGLRLLRTKDRIVQERHEAEDGQPAA